MKMRLNTDAVVCKKGRWYDGSLSGFSFRVDSKIKHARDITHISGHVSLKEWLKMKNIEDSDNKIATTLMKNVKIYARKEERIKVSVEIGKGVEKLFIYTGREEYDASKLVHNFLCEQCVWTCKQGRSVSIYSCKAFDTKMEKEKVGG